ncbi:MAG: EAL domain-containing protein [Methylobacterium sp.]|nr:EAL domain-containing protein [Methylobacterium sp.]
MRLSVSLQSLMQDRERMFDTLMANFDGMVYCCLPDAHWTMIFVSQGCEALTGFAAEALLRNEDICFEEITFRDDRERVRQAIEEAVRKQQRYDLEYRIRRADGELRWVWERGSPLFNPDGRVEALEGFIQDITLRKLSEQAAREAEERYRSIFENAIEGIYQTTPDGRYLNFNPALARIYGYDSVQELALGISDIQKQLYVDPGKRAEFIALMSRSGRVQNFDAQVYRKNGDIIWITENAREVRDDQGSLMFYEGTVEDITERKNYEQQIEYQATHDPLTGLPNRTLLADRLQQCMGFADRSGSKVGVAFVDLDQFKRINDSMGHHMGDVLLKIMAARLSQCLRDSDSVVRLGGDEFVLLLSSLQRLEDVDQSMQRVLAAVTEPCTIEGREFIVSCSIGVSIYPDDGQDANSLLKQADSAMYKAKQSGRNNYQFYTHELNQVLLQRLDLEYRLRHAIENKEFLLYYQPKIEFGYGRICGAEALIRWQPPGGPMILPAEFIPLAEDTGLIEEIGRWVLEEACRFAGRLNARPGREMPIAVNVSPRQFRQAGLTDSVQGALDLTGLDPRMLEIEITESCLADDTGQFISTLHDLKKIGVKLAIDDFGTGYSSLAYLRDFPVDRLKIDRGFVATLETVPSNAAILKAIIGLGHSLKLRVIAEGVETPYQQAFLHAVGCDELQGYLTGRPLTAGAFEALVMEEGSGAG